MLFELSMSLDNESMPDEVFPTGTPFYIAPKEHHDKGIVLGTETGTCITLPARFVEFRKTRRIHEIPPNELFLRPLTVINIPKQAGEEIEEQELASELSHSSLKSGDALLIRTGWGDQGIHRKPGSTYILDSPCFSLSAARLLVAQMKEAKSNLLLSDVAFLGRPERHLIKEWCSLHPKPPPWPSPEATLYLHLYTPSKARDDLEVDLVFAEAGIMTVKKLVDCQNLSNRSVRIIVCPLLIIRGVASTCRVLAVAE